VLHTKQNLAAHDSDSDEKAADTPHFSFGSFGTTRTIKPGKRRRKGSQSPRKSKSSKKADVLSSPNRCVLACGARRTELMRECAS
jgi:hypothetical protein